MNRISKFGFVANLFWNNAGFPAIKDLPELDDVPSTYHVCCTFDIKS